MRFVSIYCQRQQCINVPAFGAQEFFPEPDLHTCGTSFDRGGHDGIAQFVLVCSSILCDENRMYNDNLNQ